MFSFQHLINKSHVLREEVFNEILWGKLIYLEIFYEQKTNIIFTLVFEEEKGPICPDLIFTPSLGGVKVIVWTFPNFFIYFESSHKGCVITFFPTFNYEYEGSRAWSELIKIFRDDKLPELPDSHTWVRGYQTTVMISKITNTTAAFIQTEQK